MHVRVVLGMGKGFLFREVSSVQECPHRERERFHYVECVLLYYVCVRTVYDVCDWCDWTCRICQISNFWGLVNHVDSLY